MTELEAWEAARSYAANFGVPWGGVAKVRKYRGPWFRVRGYFLEIDTGGQGPARAYVDSETGKVLEFEYRPTDPDLFWLPLWAAYQHNDGLTGWRQGGGEVYWLDWHQWFTHLPKHLRFAYQARYPQPDDFTWHGFYERANRQAEAIETHHS